MCVLLGKAGRSDPLEAVTNGPDRVIVVVAPPMSCDMIDKIGAEYDRIYV